VRARGTGRRFFESKADAQRWLDSYQPETGLADEAWSSLPVLERARVIATWREITDAGLTLADVWRAYKELVPVSKPCRLGKAIDALIDSKRSANKRPTYLKNLRTMLNQFALGREATYIATIRAADIEAWLSEHATTPGLGDRALGVRSRFVAVASLLPAVDGLCPTPSGRVNGHENTGLP
jgi:hypothetical protein